MTCAFGMAGWYFSTKPTSATSENIVPKVPGSEPWKSGSSGKYEYHPGGDPSRGKKEAPSALNVVIIPDVNLPKVCLITYFLGGLKTMGWQCSLTGTC
jgi:hypothetical protein